MLPVLPMAALDLTVVVGSVGPRFHINPSIYTVINEKKTLFYVQYTYISGIRQVSIAQRTLCVKQIFFQAVCQM